MYYDILLKRLRMESNEYSQKTSCHFLTSLTSGQIYIYISIYYYSVISHITCTFWILHETTGSRNGGLQGSAWMSGTTLQWAFYTTIYDNLRPGNLHQSSIEFSEKFWTWLGVTPNNSSSSTNGDWNLQTCVEHVGLDKEWPRTLSTIMERATWLNPSPRRLSGSVAFKVVIHQIL